MSPKRPIAALIVPATVLVILLALTTLSIASAKPRTASAVPLFEATLDNSPTATTTCLPWHIVTSPNPSASTNILNSVAAVSADDVWAVGYYSHENTLYQTLTQHWDGTQWTTIPSPNTIDGSGNRLTGVAAISASDVWAVGYSTPLGGTRTLVMHWDGTQWSIVNSPNPSAQFNTLNAVAATSASDVWAVGYYTGSARDQTLVLHYDGTQWSVVLSPNVNLPINVLYGVTAISANDAWAVGKGQLDYLGSNVLILHWNGVNWNITQSPYGGTLSSLHSVSAVSANDVWAVGEALEARALIMHWDGAHWDFAYSPDLLKATLTGVTALSPTNVWAVGYYIDNNGYRSLIEYWNGTNWSIVPSPNLGSQFNYYEGVSAASANDVFAAGWYRNLSSYLDRTMIANYTGGITFSDVQPTDYFYNAVNFLYCRGAISGYADNTFRPSGSTTRGQLAKIVVLAEGWAIYVPPTPTFRDVPTSHPLYQYIETAYNHGIISGYSCGAGCLEYHPNSDITRSQLCKVIVLAQGWPLYVPPNPTFRDVPTSHPLYAYVETAYSHGIISGYGCGTGCLEFHPSSSATRGQISKIVYNAITTP